MDTSAFSWATESQTALTTALDCLSSKPLARVHDSARAIDFAIALRPSHLAVIRCVDCSTTDDYTALAIMLDEGDFAWAALVYSGALEPDWPGHIEAFHLSELPQLIQRLQELQSAAA